MKEEEEKLGRKRDMRDEGKKGAAIGRKEIGRGAEGRKKRSRKEEIEQEQEEEEKEGKE